MKKLLMMIGAAAVAVGANADTIDINGITWTYTPDESTKTLTLTALPEKTGAQISDIPWSLVITGVTYKVTALPNGQFFNKGRLTGTELAIPDWLTRIPGTYTFSDIGTLKKVTVLGATTIVGGGTFKGCTGLETLWFKGAGSLSMHLVFNGCSKMKAVLLGPDVTATVQSNANSFMNASCTACKVYCPATSTWETYKEAGPGGSGVEVILYGNDEDLNLVVDETAHTITATVKTLDMLKAVLGSAQYFKSGMGLDTRINVTTALDIPLGTITSDQLQYATFNTLMVAATTQEKLRNILSVVPPTVPVCIDATGATQNLTVSTSDGRNVYVRLPENGTYKLRPDGLSITFH